MPIAEEYGGAGASIMDCVIANEAIAEGGHDGGFNLSLGAHWVIGSVPIWLHGTEEQKQRWLPGLTDGSMIGAWASTEPEAGSDAAGLRTTAVRDGDDWVLNGTKIFITNGPIADVCTVLAKTSEKSATAFIVDTDQPRLPGRPRAGQDGLPVLADRRDRAGRLPGARPTACSATRARRCGGSRSSASTGSARS